MERCYCCCYYPDILSQANIHCMCVPICNISHLHHATTSAQPKCARHISVTINNAGRRELISFSNRLRSPYIHIYIPLHVHMYIVRLGNRKSLLLLLRCKEFHSITRPFHHFCSRNLPMSLSALSIVGGRSTGRMNGRLHIHTYTHS